MSRETSYRIEPCHLDRYSAELADVVSEVVRNSTVLGHQLHPQTAASLADLVVVMNCYYSNLIEGHNTRPREIEQALNEQMADGARRDLQLEARAHIRVQRAIDQRFANGSLEEPASSEFVRWVHRAFYQDAPESALQIKRGQTTFEMVPGAFRNVSFHDNMVGRHQPPSSEHVESLMAYFGSRYRSEPLGTAARIVAIATAHHRLNYIHPFPDGNGRVSRLVSHAMALKAGIGAHGLWSISRGLARGLDERGEYKRMMDLADAPRKSDLDGRGNLSLSALETFVMWFCRVELDQLQFMESLFDLSKLRERLQAYVRGTLGAKAEAWLLIDSVLQRGEVPRGEAGRIVGRPERTARDVLRGLIESGLLTSQTPKGAVRLHFTGTSADELFPRLFPAQQD